MKLKRHGKYRDGSPNDVPEGVIDEDMEVVDADED